MRDFTATIARRGRYFEGRREIRSSEESYDRENAADLWATSERLLHAGHAAHE
jgi:hypothetical protein